MRGFGMKVAAVAVVGTALVALAGQGASAATASCRRGYFCTWERPDYKGTQIDYYYCTPDRQVMPFAYNGSYFNNQTGGARARFFDDEGREWAPSLPPGQGDPLYNWQLVYYIDPC